MANQLDRPGMSAEERREAKAKLVLAGRVQHWRKLMKEGKEERAAEYVKTYKFEEEIAEELRAMKAAPKSESVALEVVEIPEVRVDTILDVERELADGWPVRAEGSVEKYPINPKMVLVHLAAPDGREVRLWNDGPRRWKLGAKVKMKIAEMSGGEPIYEGVFE